MLEIKCQIDESDTNIRVGGGSTGTKISTRTRTRVVPLSVPGAGLPDPCSSLLAIVVKLERFELLPNDIRLPVKNFVDALDRFYNVIAAYHTITNRAEWQALNYRLIEIRKISFKNLRQRHDEIALQVSRVVRGGYFEILVGKNNPLVPLGL